MSALEIETTEAPAARPEFHIDRERAANWLLRKLANPERQSFTVRFGKE
jgi:hypothetical protein